MSEPKQVTVTLTQVAGPDVTAEMTTLDGEEYRTIAVGIPAALRILADSFEIRAAKHGTEAAFEAPTSEEGA